MVVDEREEKEVEIVVPQKTMYELLVQGLPFERKDKTEEVIRKAFTRLYVDYIAGEINDDKLAEERIREDLEKQGYEVEDVWISLKIKQKPKAGTFHKHRVAIATCLLYTSPSPRD